MEDLTDCAPAYISLFTAHTRLRSLEALAIRGMYRPWTAFILTTAGVTHLIVDRRQTFLFQSNVLNAMLQIHLLYILKCPYMKTLVKN